jgi:cytochrome P450
MYIGGADTTVFALGTFVLAMLACPKVQKKAQAEIDSLTGGRYLPSFEDEASLPYISALVKEVMRWENVTPFGELIDVPSRLVTSLPTSCNNVTSTLLAYGKVLATFLCHS